jgi:hypothetical protein
MPPLPKAIVWHARPMLDVWRQTLDGAVGVSVVSAQCLWQG